jgi:anti-sigma regulatory factor (Ser/Thr protein kinase)
MTASDAPALDQAIRLTIPAKAEYISLARLALTGLSRLRVFDAETLADLKLAITEATSNSVRHAYASGDGTVEVTYDLQPDRLVIEVSDDGEGFDVPPISHGDSEAGRGLELVQELADRWGRPTGVRTSVWFEIDRVPIPLHAAPPISPAEPAAASAAQAIAAERVGELH